MRVSGLLNLLVEVRDVGARVPMNGRVRRAFSDSREIGPEDLFIALPGIRSQGVDYLESAFERGCVAALIPHAAEVPAKWRERCIAVDRIRYNAAQAACAAFGYPTEHLLTFGVTGTNGKTSTCHILRHLLHAAGHRVVLITTVAHEFGDWRRETPNTTPDAARLQSVLARAREEGASAAVLEVSAHGVTLERITGCRFDGLVFTNLSPDHLDFYDDMEAYFQAKLALFTDPAFHKTRCVGVACTDDAYGRRIVDESRIPICSFGTQAQEDGLTGDTHADASGLEVTPGGIRGPLRVGNQEFRVDTNLTATFNRLNLAGATALVTAAGLDPEVVNDALRQPISVPGRLMTVASSAPFRVVVDFAHTELAMRNLLSGLRDECEGRLIVVFGAGGDRDRERRRGLPRAVVELADVGVITLDNPRGEPPEATIEAMQGHWHERAAALDSPAELLVQPDRKQAIAAALDAATAGDIVVLAGKGHETGQIFADRTEPHDDREVAATCLEKRGFSINPS